MVVKIILIIVIIILIIRIIKYIISYYLLKKVSQDSLIVFGKKGKGKTFLFSFMARMNRKHGYGSTTQFLHKNELHVSYKDINVAPNNWESVLNDNIQQIKKNPLLENKPIFLDDAGVYLPNFADNLLKKKYDSFPVSLAIWRHLYNAPIHINSQDLERCWKMVREQADGFIKVVGVRRRIFTSRIEFIYYDKYSSAQLGLEPMTRLLFNKFGRSEYELYQAQNGTIRRGAVLAFNSHHKYDSRYFHSLFFGFRAQQKKEKTSCKKLPK